MSALEGQLEALGSSLCHSSSAGLAPHPSKCKGLPCEPVPADWKPYQLLETYCLSSIFHCASLEGNMAASFNAYTDKFSFARSATRRHEVGRDHLQKALAQIDGLFAGLNYLDKTEPSIEPAFLDTSPSNSFTTQSWCDLDTPVNAYSDELEITPTTSQTVFDFGDDGDRDTGSTSEPDPRKYDWSSICNVRDGMDVLWETIESVAEDLKSLHVDDLRRYYGNARTLRETGVFAFRSTLTGPAPSDLRNVFAFTSLTYVVQSLLHEKGRLEECDILDGIQVWMNTIQDEGERRLFQILAERIWPEAKTHLHFIDLPNYPHRDIPSPVPMPQHQSSWDNNHSAPEEVEQSTVQQFGSVAWQDHVSSAQNYPYMGGMQYNYWPTEGQADLGASLMAQTVNNITNNAHDCWQWYQFSQFRDFGPDSFNSGQECSNLVLTQPSTQLVEGGHLDSQSSGYVSVNIESVEAAPDPLQGEVSITTSNLRETKMFYALLLFFELLGQLPYILSGKGLTAKGLESCLTFCQVQQKKRKQIRKEFLKPLKQHKVFENPCFRALLWMAKQFVDRGNLQSVEEVRAYLLTVGRVSRSVHPQAILYLRSITGSLEA